MSGDSLNFGGPSPLQLPPPSGTGGSDPLPPTPGSVPTSGGVVGGMVIALPGTPVAHFTYTKYANNLVGFVNTSIGTISAYQWYFGDGTFSSVPNPLHQYTGPGTYYVTLRVKNSVGMGMTSQYVTIAAAPIALVVDFSYITGSLSVKFTDLSTQSGVRNWDFGDGLSSLEVNPYHTYASNGAYLVTLTIGSQSKSYQVVVDRGVRLNWQDNSSDETGFKIERSPNGSTGWTQIATTGVGVNTLLVTKNLHGVDPTVVNYFRVCAYNGNGNSGYSNTISSQCL